MNYIILTIILIGILVRVIFFRRSLISLKQTLIDLLINLKIFMALLLVIMVLLLIMVLLFMPIIITSYSMDGDIGKIYQLILGIIPSLLFFVLVFLVVEFEKELTTSVHEGIFMINISIAIYGFAELGLFNHEIYRYIGIAILFIFLWSVYNNIKSKNISPQGQFWIILINLIIINIIGGIYFFSTYNSYITDISKNSLSWQQIGYYFLVGFNLLFILQQIFLLLTIFPGKRQSVKSAFLEAFCKYNGIYLEGLHAKTIRFFSIVIIPILILYTLNYFIHFIDPIKLMGIILCISTIIEIPNIKGVLFEEKNNP